MKLGVLTGRGIAQVELSTYYATERAPALPTARLVRIVELRSKPRSTYAMLTKGFWAFPPTSNF